MADILLEHTDDGGDVRVAGGNLAIDDGLSTAVYLSLFGGNGADDGTDATASLQWWGNRLETEPARKFRCAMHALIKAHPLTSASLLGIEQAGARDLAWLVDEGLAEAIAVECSILGVDRIAIAIKIQTSDRAVALGYEVTRAP